MIVGAYNDDSSLIDERDAADAGAPLGRGWRDSRGEEFHSYSQRP